MRGVVIDGRVRIIVRRRVQPLVLQHGHLVGPLVALVAVHQAPESHPVEALLLVGVEDEVETFAGVGHQGRGWKREELVRGGEVEGYFRLGIQSLRPLVNFGRASQWDGRERVSEVGKSAKESECCLTVYSLVGETVNYPTQIECIQSIEKPYNSLSLLMEFSTKMSCNHKQRSIKFDQARRIF